MAEGVLPASFVARVRERLQSSDQPLVQMWGWPWSAKRALLAAFAAEDPERYVELPPHAPLTDRISRKGPRWFLAHGRYRSSDLLRAADLMAPGQRLIIAVERRVVNEVLPLRILEPCQMLLRRGEIEEMFAVDGASRAVDGRQVDELSELTDGWAGPLSWLRDRWQRDRPIEHAVRGPSFGNRFHQRVISRLDLEVFELILECSLLDRLDPEVWRRVWLSQGERLSALERLISEWGWTVPEGQVMRLPHLLRQAARSRGLSAQRQRDTYRRLGLASHALGHRTEAARYLELAGDSRRLGRLQVLGPETALRGPTSQLDGAESRQTTSFRIRLLGQPVVERREADECRDVAWRLRRAFEGLAFLALAPDHRASKEQLVEAIWHDSDAEAIAKNFHPTMSEARRAMGEREVFSYRQGLYTLNPDFDWWIDCEQFQSCKHEGDQLLSGPTEQEERALDLWNEAWKLYRGTLLADSDAPWIEPLRAAYYRDYIELLRRIGGLCGRLGQVTQAIDAYRSLLLEEPFEERVHLALMELYSQLGRRDLVRRQFVRMQELLLEELNVEPLESTQDRYYELMR